MEIFEAGIDDVLSYLHYPQPHRTRISSTNPLERLNLEIRRRARVIGIFPHSGACLRLIGMLLVEKKTTGSPTTKPISHSMMRRRRSPRNSSRWRRVNEEGDIA